MAPYTLNGPLLTLENIGLTLGGNTILRNVNATVHDIVRPGMTQGQIIGFLGPSGIGKTKLFEVIAGLIQPSTGTVLLGSEQKPVVTGRVGVVQQCYPLFNHRTVRSNLTVAAGKCDDKGVGVQARVNEMLERFNMMAHHEKYPAQLSGGQRQRVAIAQQLLCSETFLLLDEPFSGLDPNMTDEVAKLLVEIANKHEENTIIIVSHDITATAAISDTLWVMGRDRNPDGSIVPGAYIKHNYNMVEKDLAWRSDIRWDPDFQAFVREVRELFPSL